MPASFETKETFPASVSQAQIDEEIRLRMKAGAIRSKAEKKSNGEWLLTTEWNVIGEQ